MKSFYNIFRGASNATSPTHIAQLALALRRVEGGEGGGLFWTFSIHKSIIFRKSIPLIDWIKIFFLFLS